MKLTDEAAQDLYRQATLSPADGDRCPTIEAIEAAAQASGRTSAPSELADHLGRCSTCGQIYLTARRSVDRTPSTRLGPGRIALSMAAALALAAVGLNWWLSTPLSTIEDVRATSSASNMTGIEPIEPIDGADLENPPPALRWSADGPVDSYQVLLYNQELDPLWQSPPLARESVDVPEAVRAQLTSSTVVYWRVVKTTGIERTRSALFHFQWVPSTPASELD